MAAGDAETTKLKGVEYQRVHSEQIGKRVSQGQTLRIIHLTEVQTEAEQCAEELTRAGWVIQSDQVATREEFSVRLWSASYDLVLVAHRLKEWKGSSVVEVLRKLRRDVPVILVAGAVGEDSLAEALREGVSDYVPVQRLGYLPTAVSRILAERAERSEKRRLAEERDRFFMLSSDLLCIVDGKGCLIQLNPAWQRTLGFDIEELVKQPLAEWVHPEDRSRLSESIQSLASGASSLEFETRCLAADGSFRWLQWRASSMPRQPLVYATARDITDRRQAERSLQTSEARKGAIMEASPDSIINLDPSGRILEWNQAASQTFHWGQKQLLGQGLLEVILPRESRDQFGSLFTEGGQISGHFELGRRVELKGLRSNGDEFPMEMVITCTHACGSPLYTVFIRDITERKANESRIRDQAALLDKAHEAIWVQDLQGVIQYWNRSAERMYGWLSEEVCGSRVEERLQEGDAGGRMAPAVQTLIEKGEWKGELTHLSRDGKKLIVLSQRTLVRTPEGQPKAVLVINSNITEHKALEAQLLRSQRIESIGTLASGIAHDLNNVLTPILMAVEILLEKSKEPRAQKLLKTVQSSAQHGAAMVKQILAFSKGADGEKLPLQLNPLVEEMRGFARDTFPRGVIIQDAIAPDLWMVKGDATQLHQVLLNLCVNARDAMPQGGVLKLEACNRELDDVYARLHLEARPGPYVVLTVTDSGIGIPPQVLEKIFEPFFTTKDSSKGTGLGLSTVLAIVRGHEGFMTVYSEVGKGSRFSVYLPATPSQRPQETLPVPASDFEGHGETVLVVDDESSFREISREILEKHNYRVITATEGAEALAILVQKRGKISAAITDMVMPVMDGPSTLRAIRKLDPNIALIATSGMPVSERFRPLDTLEKVPFLLKPYPSAQLLETVHQAISNAKSKCAP